jgi:RNA polymerase sigma factor (sigma-70 family)
MYQIEPEALYWVDRISMSLFIKTMSRQPERMTASAQKSIHALVCGCREGDARDWSELIDRITPLIFSICYRFRLSEEESYDVFGKVSLIVLENLPNLRKDERIFGYVATVTHHEASAVKTRKLSSFEPLSENIPGTEMNDFDSVPVDLDRDRDLAILARAFQTLSAKCRELVHLLFLDSEELSYRDIAGRMKIPVSSIGPTRARCLEKLRRTMLREGYEK